MISPKTLVFILLLVAPLLAQYSDVEKQQYCKTDAQCPSGQYCSRYVLQGQLICTRIFYPFHALQFFGTVCMALVIGLAIACGIGGGTILTPIMIATFGYQPKKAVKISFLMLLAGTLASFAAYVTKRTTYGTPAIQYDLAVVSLPLLMVGAILGVAATNFFPTSVVCVVIIGIVSDSFRKIFMTYRKREQAKKDAASEQQALLEKKADQEMPEIKEGEKQPVNTDGKLIPANCPDPALLTRLIKRERKQFPTLKIMKMTVSTLLILTILILRGGLHFKSVLGIVPCSLNYWYFNILALVVGGILIYLFGSQLIWQEKNKQELGFDFNFYGQQVDTQICIKVIVGSAIAGLLGGMCGIGGGIILTPLWYQMGFKAERVPQTAMFVAFFTDLIGTMTNYIGEAYEPDELVFFGALGFGATYIVAKLLVWLITKYQKQHYLLIITLCLLFLAFTLMVINSTLSFIEDPTLLYTFGMLC